MIYLRDKSELEGKIILLGELSYFGKQKDQKCIDLSNRFGDHWKIGWYVDGEIETKETALILYEDAYFNFLNNDSKVLDWLVNTASEVYDISTEDVKSALDYSIQTSEANHLQDIAIRRCLYRLNKEFQGDHLVQVRGRKTEGYVLNPGKVPFHIKHYILHSKDTKWWNPDSVEAFYQHNKVLAVDEDDFKIEINKKKVDGNRTIYRLNSGSNYSTFSSDPSMLIKLD
jgi:hypothetical protein